jgi:hypothetical protein
MNPIEVFQTMPELFVAFGAMSMTMPLNFDEDLFSPSLAFRGMSMRLPRGTEYLQEACEGN